VSDPAEVLVLCYHGVSPTWPAETSVTPERFAAQLRSLLAAGYHPATARDALTAPGPGRTMAVTFDDAHRSVLEQAVPIMRALGVVGTIYVPTDYAGTDRLMAWSGYDTWVGTEHADELRCMTWEELRGLAGEGWEIGSHTRSHPRLTQIPDDQLADELAGSRRACEEAMGEPCLSIAYPYGDHDDRVVRATRDAGYALGVTVPRTWEVALPLAWPRVAVYHGDDERRLRLRAWRRAHPAVDGVLGRVRAAVRR
jgi:peptidoglycan/xylan/chitin deacetylase (PgdA/CDA1 family)